MLKISQVAGFKSCLTCVHRKPYPAATRNGQPVFYRFFCGLSPDSLKESVKPEEVCDYWQGITLDVE